MAWERLAGIHAQAFVTQLLAAALDPRCVGEQERGAYGCTVRWPHSNEAVFQELRRGRQTQHQVAILLRIDSSGKY